MSKIIGIADLHLDAAGESYLYEKDTMECIETFMKRICAVDDVVVFCGDIFEKSGVIVDEHDGKIVKDIDSDRICKVLKCFVPLGVKVIFSPGNHDIARDVLSKNRKEASTVKRKKWNIKPPYSPENDDEKYGRIRDVLTKLNAECPDAKVNANLTVNEPIVEVYEKNKVLLISLNSTVKIGVNNEPGFIDDKKLDDALNNIKRKMSHYDGKTKVAILHHNLLPFGTTDSEVKDYNTQGAAGNVENSKAVMSVLKKYGVSNVICGHAHGIQTERYASGLETETTNFFTLGSMGNKGQSSTISELCVDDTTGKIIAKNVYVYAVAEGQRKMLTFSEEHAKPKDSLFDMQVELSPELEKKKEDQKLKIASEADEFFVDIARSEKMIKTGHFHKDNQGFLTWVDMTNLLTRRCYLDRVVFYFNTLYGDDFKQEDTAVVGLGMKGTILASALRPYIDCPVSFYYDNEADSGETSLAEMFRGLKKPINIKKLIILEDIFCTGGSIKRFLADKNVSGFLSDDVSIKVLCIFGMCEEDTTLANGKHAFFSCDDGCYEVCSLSRLPAKICDCKDFKNCRMFSKRLCQMV